MTATNINIEEFIHILDNLRANGTRLINLDMLQDDDHPSMNKLVIHPVEDIDGSPPVREQRIVIRNPNISPDGDDIFNAFKGLV